MKVGNPLTTALPSPAQALGPRKADAWQAQLERAWLDSWHDTRPEHQGTPNPGAPGMASPTTPARPDRAELTHLHEQHSADARGSGLSAQVHAAPINPQHECIQPATAPCALMARPLGAPAGATSSELTGQSPCAKALPPSSPAKLALPLLSSRGDTAPPPEAEVQPGTASDQASRPSPARSSLQVAVASGTAQVTLRDAALNTNEAVRIPHAIAHRLLESGLDSVRLYVNGRLSQYTRSNRSPSEQHTPPDTGSHADPLYPAAQERK